MNRNETHTMIFAKSVGVSKSNVNKNKYAFGFEAIAYIKYTKFE